MYLATVVYIQTPCFSSTLKCNLNGMFTYVYNRLYGFYCYTNLYTLGLSNCGFIPCYVSYTAILIQPQTQVLASSPIMYNIYVFIHVPITSVSFELLTCQITDVVAIIPIIHIRACIGVYK